MKHIPRRTFLKTTAATGSAVALGSLLPASALADWPQSAFQAKTLDEALNALFETQGLEVADDKIHIKAPEIAENGRVVPIQVSTHGLADLQSISIFAEKNPSPLVAKFNLSNTAEGYVSTRIKMSETSNVRAIVKAGGKLYTSAREVKVTIGGCGG